MDRTFQPVEYGVGPYTISWEEAHENPDLENLLLDYMFDQLGGLMEFEETIERNPSERNTEYCAFGQTWKEVDGCC